MTALAIIGIVLGFLTFLVLATIAAYLGEMSRTLHAIADRQELEATLRNGH